MPGGGGPWRRRRRWRHSARDAPEPTARDMPDLRHESVGWARRWWRPLLAEVVSTALLVALGVASLLQRQQPADHWAHPPLEHPALAFGFVVIANIAAFGAASGAHMNPAVTLAGALHGLLPPAAAAGYVVAQCAGAALGYMALVGVAAGASLPDAGCTLPAPGVTPAAAAAIEALLTGTLALACCGVWSGAHDPSAPIKLGLTVAGLVYAGGWLTGASLNPARSLAPALYHGCWRAHWAYWVGPLGGAALAALLHRALRAPPAPARAPAPAHEELPLRDKQDV